ncbi:MAG TPA: hypothetical protein VFI31_07570 [Pirellulales bacterium]|nr:hypothetical protein [Pirellulales bacterium]
MLGYYVFEAQIDGPKARKLLGIFCSTNAIAAEDIADLLGAYCDASSAPDEILLIVPAPFENQARDAVGSQWFIDHLPAVTRYLNPPAVRVAPFSARGPDTFDDEEKLVVRRGLMHLFNRHQGVLPATATHHYAKPSGKHASAFVRTGHVLVDGAEIDFVAFCCLAWAPNRLRRIYCDTGTIHSVAYALLRLFALFGDRRSTASIDSFHSYAGLRDLKLRDAEAALVLVSASTSGELVKRLLAVEPRLPAAQALTLFYLGEQAPDGPVLCDMRFDAKANPEGFEPVLSYSAEECPYCRRDSIPVTMAGEHFSPQATAVTQVIVRESDAPRWLSRFMERIHGRGVVRANFGEDDTALASRDIFFDLERVFEDRAWAGIVGLDARFQRLADSILPLSANRIICLNDSASVALALRLAEFARSLDKSLSVFSLAAIESQLDEHIQDSQATVVIASAMATGRRLLAAAQVLRHIQKNDAVSYGVGLVRTADVNVLKDVRGNLTYGQYPQEHAFFRMEEVFLPTWRPDRKTAWNVEEDVMTRLAESCPDDGSRKAVLERLAVLQRSHSKEQRGLLDDLFLTSPRDASLRLREGFAFWKFTYDVATVSQADVFITMLAVLHELRQLRHGVRALGRDVHSAKVISPRCFERFNDGAVQAALLRSAYPGELDYSGDYSLSDEMKGVLEFIFGHAKVDAGEATNEFLLALVAGQLRIDSAHLDSLVRDFADSCDWPIGRVMWDSLRAVAEAGSSRVTGA